MNITAYRNLNRRDSIWYSVKHQGKVIDYQKSLILRNALFKHSTPRALERIRAKHREVSCWIRGVWVDEAKMPDKLIRVHCDPKKYDHFTNSETGEKIDAADVVVLNDRGCFFGNYTQGDLWTR